MPAFSSSSPSCRPSFVGKRRLVLSPSNANPAATENRDKFLNSVLDIGGAGGLVDLLTENLFIPSTDYLFYSPSLPKKRDPFSPTNSDRCYRNRGPVRPFRPDVMDASYPGHLRPTDHPILNDFHKSASSPSSILRSCPEEPEPETPSNSTTPTASSATQPEKRRSKRYGQQGGRYRTTPITLEEIREVDEEMYAKQHPGKKDEETEDQSNNTTRNSPYRLCPGNFGPKKSCSNNGTSDFRCTYMTKTQLLPIRALWPSHSNVRQRHRSQESLAQSGHTPLPTIPEERRHQQQQQQQRSVVAPVGPPLTTSVTITVQAPPDPGTDTSNSGQVHLQTNETCQPLKLEGDVATNDNRIVHVG